MNATLRHLVTKVILSAALGILTNNALADATQLVQPPYNVKTRHSVDVVNDQVQLTHSDVRIGGDMGLQHSISTLSGSWAGADDVFTGPQDSFGGRLFCSRRNAYTGDQRSWVLASDPETTQIFDPGSDPITPQPNAQGVFPSISHRGHTLAYESAEGGMVMTKPDGTKIIYSGGNLTNLNSCVGTFGFMREIRRPNGFSVKIKLYSDAKPTTVTTNTGIQLRYYYVPRSTSVDAKGWWGMSPAYVVGFNLASITCPDNVSSQLDGDCSSSLWPKAQYIWPDNMPDTMRNGPGTFAVVNPDGTRSEYDQKSFSTTGTCPGCPYTRVTEVRSPATRQSPLRFTYTNRTPKAGPVTLGTYWATDIGALTSSSMGNDSISYNLSETMQGSYSASTGYQVISSIQKNTATDSSGGKLMNISSWNYSAQFNSYGMVSSFGDKTTGVTSTYGYDARDNVTSITTHGVTQYADYETSCDANNFRYCNKPKSVSDFKGNKTYFTYHQPSGQVATMTLPANKNGVIAVTRYGYDLKYANYFNGAGVKTPSTTGVWLKTSEKTCISSATTGDACAAGATDEVITRYEYDSDNLWLTAVTVTALESPGCMKTHRTTYQYDKYGNRIGEIKPKANADVCN